MDSLLLLSWIARITTIALFLTGVPTMQKVRLTRSVGGLSCVPYLAGITCSLLWFQYGQTHGDGTIVSVNAVGAALNGYYLAVYYFFTADRAMVHKQLGVMLTAVCMAWLILQVLVAPDAVLGYLACFFTVVMFGSPLVAVATVLRTRSTETMVFSLSLMSFIVSAVWALYGHLIADMFVVVPNLLGAVLALLQLSLFFKFPAKKFAVSPIPASAV